MLIETIEIDSTKIYFYDDFINQDKTVINQILSNISEIICKNN